MRPVLHTIRMRAKAKGLEFDLTEEDMVAPDNCPVLGIPLVRNQGSGWHDDSPSLDRKDPTKGYTRDNVQWISNRANRIKCDATAEELEKVLVYVRSLE